MLKKTINIMGFLFLINLLMIHKTYGMNEITNQKPIFSDGYSELDETDSQQNKAINSKKITKILQSAKTDYYKAMDYLNQGDTVNAAKYFEKSIETLNPLASYPNIENNSEYIDLLQTVLDDYELFLRKTRYIDENTPFYIVSKLYMDESDSLMSEYPSELYQQQTIIVQPGYIPPPDSMVIPLIDNEQVRRNIEFLTNPRLPGLRTVKVWFERSSKWFPMFKRYANEVKVPEELVYIALQESCLDPKAVSDATAVGLWQFMRPTGTQYGLNANHSIWIDERRDPEKSTKAAMQYFKDLYNEFGDWYLAMAAYNYGPGSIKREMKKTGIEKPTFWDIQPNLPTQTKFYIPQFIAIAKIFAEPKKYGIIVDSLKFQSEFRYDIVRIDSSINISALAKAAGISEKELLNYNPELIKNASPPGGYNLKIPEGTKNIFTINYSKLTPEEKITYITHEVKRRETVAKIADLYAVTKEELMVINNISSSKAKLQTGDILRIPFDPNRQIPPSSNNTDVKKNEVKTIKNSEYITHIVQKGETLFNISQKYNINIEILKELNEIPENNETIQIGDELIIAKRNILPDASHIKKLNKPKTIRHKVKQGENLNQIAQLYSVSIDEIKEWNSLSDDVIVINQVLKIITTVDVLVTSKNNSKNNIDSMDEVIPQTQRVKSVKQAEIDDRISESTTKSKSIKKTSIHKVRKGETLSGIAEEYGITIDLLRSLNPDKINEDQIIAGSTLKITGKPPKATVAKKENTTNEKNVKAGKEHHKVVAGENFSTIAKKYGISVKQLTDLNPAIKPELLQIGQNVRIK